MLVVATSAACGESASAPDPITTRTCDQSGPVLLRAGKPFDPAPTQVRRLALERVLDDGRLLISDVSPEGGGLFVVEACGGESIEVPREGIVRGGGAALWIEDGERVGYWPVAAGGEVEWTEGERAVGYVAGVGLAVWDAASEEVRLRTGPDAGTMLFAPPIRLNDSSFISPTYAAAAVQSAGTVIGVLDLDDRLHVADGASAGQGLVVDDVLEFALSPTGRTVLVELRPGEQPTMLRAYDRISGAVTEVGNERAAPGHFRGPYGVFDVGVYDPDTTSLVPYPAGIDDPLYYGGSIMIDAGAGVRWDVATGETTALDELAPEPRTFGHGPDYDYPPFSPSASGAAERRHDITVVPFDGSAPFVVEVATRVFTLPSGATVFHNGELGEDVPLFEPLYAVGADGEPGLLEEAAGAFWVLPEGDLVVEVQDGERSGLYRVGLP